MLHVRLNFTSFTGTNGVAAACGRVLALCCIVVFSLLTSPARAESDDLPPAVRLFFDALRLDFSDLKPKAGAVHQDDGAIVLDDVSLLRVREGEKDILSVTAQRVRLQGVSEQADGLVFYRQIRVENLRALVSAKSTYSLRVDIPSILIAEASILPREAATTDIEKIAAKRLQAAAVHIPLIRFVSAGKPTIEWRGMGSTWKGDRRTGKGETRVDLGRLRIPLLEMVEGNDAKAAETREKLRALGLSEFVMDGNVTQYTSWSADRRLHVANQLQLHVQNAGTLNLRIVDLALPIELLQLSETFQMKDFLNKQGKNPGTPPPNPMNDPRFAAALQRLTIGEITLGWADEGLTRKLLQWEAKRAGRDVAAYTATLLKRLQAQMALLPPEAAAKAVEALKAYLANPKNLQISISGAGGRPVSVAALPMLLMMPQMLAGTIRIRISANE